jgi:methanogenic corrinoid protein MtbC1
MTVDLAPWREMAVSAVEQSLYASHPGLTERFGARGRKACREDIQHHLDYLSGALLADSAAVFVDYAIWLKSILDNRGVPGNHLAESFNLLDDFLCAHMPAAESAQVSAVIFAANAALARNDLPVPYVHTRVPDLPDTPHYREAAVSGNQGRALALISRSMQEGSTLSEASVRMVQPAMYEIGRLWQENRITVAQEHLATAISQSVLARAYMQADFAASTGQKSVFACVAGNQHSLGLRMLADAFETAGWDSLYLGADVPTTDLLRQVDASSPNLLVLSLSLPGHLAVARATLEQLHAELGSRCPQIWVGGLATLMGNQVWRSIKADGWAADALHALEQVAAR